MLLHGLYGNFSIGYPAAVAAAGCFAFNSYLFSHAGKYIGSDGVTHIRLWIAFGLNTLIHLCLFGHILPYDASTKAWFYLSISGIVGYVIGDSMGFEALLRLGAHPTSVVQTTSPIFALLMAYFFFNERLNYFQFSGILLVILGILLVLHDRRKKFQHPKHLCLLPASQQRWSRSGILLAIGSSFCQAAGIVLSKMGMQGSGISASSANVIRIVAATTGAFLIHLYLKRVSIQLKKVFTHRRAARQLLLGSLLGPVSGVIFLLYAISTISVGIASTLSQTTPVMLLFITHYLEKEHVGKTAIIGTFVAFSGATVLFLGK
ncbi:MAG: DMT family transporter [Oligoflexia bacterium]|nr:DMT family transporter [Oligoflexia bacterium]